MSQGQSQKYASTSRIRVRLGASVALVGCARVRRVLLVIGLVFAALPTGSALASTRVTGVSAGVVSDSIDWGPCDPPGPRLQCARGSRPA